jgi:hypothetical protein
MVMVLLMVCCRVVGRKESARPGEKEAATATRQAREVRRARCALGTDRGRALVTLS